MVAPEWAYSTTGWPKGSSEATAAGGGGAAGEMKYDIYLDGEKLKSASDMIYLTADSYGDNLTSGGVGAGLTFTGTVNLTDSSRTLTAAEAKDHKVSIEITSIEWNYIPIYFVMAKGYEDIDLGLPTVLWTGNSTLERSVTFYAEKLTGFNYATATIDGATEKDGDNIIRGMGDRTKWDLTPVGNKAITVTATPDGTFKNTYTVKGEGDLGKADGGVVLTQFRGVSKTGVVDKAETVKVIVTEKTGIEAGDTARVEIKLSSSTLADTAVEKYIATLTIGDQVITQELKDTGGETFDIDNVTEDIVITVGDIDITVIEKIRVVDVKTNGNQALVMTFNKAVEVVLEDATEFAPKGNGSVELSADGMKITARLDSGKWGTGETKIVFTAGIMGYKDATKWEKDVVNETITIEYKSDGTWSCTLGNE